MKKIFKYMLSAAAVALMGSALSACTNEDDLDMGAEGEWKVSCTQVNAPGVAEATVNQIQQTFQQVCCNDFCETEKDEDGNDVLDANDNPKYLNHADQSETQAYYWLELAAETCYQYLNSEDHQDVRQALPNGSTITFTLYRVTNNNGVKKELANSKAVVTVSDADVKVQLPDLPVPEK